ncbi:hypothetical protein CDAR_490121 [Caerostris darwini]|uniref:Uncharacterized protein n=1 Tax=Caerostris darwini TaxID=1538125 RepID=A0AAV4TM11_9ARAC|nr:hypothetical protein CDAR_490121 [Caerostris darwini]
MNGIKLVWKVWRSSRKRKRRGKKKKHRIPAICRVYRFLRPIDQYGESQLDGGDVSHGGKVEGLHHPLEVKVADKVYRVSLGIVAF